MITSTIKRQWKIERKSIAVPTLASASYSYTGSTIAPVLEPFSSTEIILSGDTSAKMPGDYTLTMTPTKNHVWPDGSTDSKNLSWSIAGFIPVNVPSQSGTLTYNGNAQSPTWTGYDSTKLTLGGVTTGTNAGAYTATFTPKDGYCWDDQTQTAKNITWSIGNAVISAVPSQSGSLTYTGSSQSPSWNSYNTAQLSIGGTTSSTNAGTFTAIFTPKTNYQWNDGSTTAKNVSWSIGKAAGTLSISPTSLSFTSTGSENAQTVAVTSSNSGTATASSNNTTVATVSANGKTVSVTPIADGSASITIGMPTDTNYLAPTSKTCSVSVSLPVDFADATPSKMKQIVQSGQALNQFAVGDLTSISASGTVAGNGISGSMKYGILGINHNAGLEGNNRIHIGLLKNSSNINIAYVDSGFNNYQTSGFIYNPKNNSKYASASNEYKYGFNEGGWESSYLRNTVCSDFYNILPDEWKNAITACTKYTDNVAGTKNNNLETSVTATSDKVFILSEFEVFGVRQKANPYEQNKQAQYDYYKNGNSKVRYESLSTSTTCWWWTRSPDYSGSYLSVVVLTSGAVRGYECTNSGGFVPAISIS